MFGKKNSDGDTGLWSDYQADSEYNFICEVRCQLEQEYGEVLLNWAGEVKSRWYGDPVTYGMGVIPVLPSRFGVNVTAVYTREDYSGGFPFTLGHDRICVNGHSNSDYDYGPRVEWYNNGELALMFEHPNEEYTPYYFYPGRYGHPSINVGIGDVLTLQLEIYEDKFYVVNYAVNGNTLLANAMATFDGSICGLDSCGASNYTQKVQY